MNEQEALQILRHAGAIITDGHFVYTSGKHGSVYINKDAVYPHIRVISQLCYAIAEHFSHKKVYYGIDTVVGPAIGGAILSAKVADLLGQMVGSGILSLYAEKIDDGEFVFRRGYDKLVPDRRVLVVEDVLTTGGSARKVIEATRNLGGKVIGLGVLCNRGGVTLQDVANPPELFALVNMKLDSWDEEECPLCALDVPINEEVGKGREFLARRKAG